MAVTNKKKSRKTRSGAKKTVNNVKKKTSKAGTARVTKGTSKANKTVKDKKLSSSKLPDKRLSKTYLSDRELKFFKELIIEQKTEILENARRLRESLIDNAGDYVGDNSTFSMHMAEQGSDEMEREKAYMFIQRDEKHLFYLENALERIGKKMYGLCISCGKPISKARLEAVPITSHCINCKQNLSS
jgi:RNA polymerase-binding protein DksA